MTVPLVDKLHAMMSPKKTGKIGNKSVWVSEKEEGGETGKESLIKLQLGSTRLPH